MSTKSCIICILKKIQKSVSRISFRDYSEHILKIWTKPVKKCLQKRAVKWILFEEYTSYTFTSYVLRCKQLNIMPLSDRFDFLDLTFFFKTVKGLIPVELPPYIIPYEGNSRLRSSHLDYLCYVSTVTPRTETNQFARSFFYRTLTRWNHIPLEIRQLDSLAEFKDKFSKCMWSSILTDIRDSDEVSSGDEFSE